MMMHGDHTLYEDIGKEAELFTNAFKAASVGTFLVTIDRLRDTILKAIKELLIADH